MASPAPSAATPLDGCGLGLVGMGPAVGHRGRDGGYQSIAASRGGGDDDVITTLASSMRLDEVRPRPSIGCSAQATDTSQAPDGVSGAGALDEPMDSTTSTEGNDERGCDLGDRIDGGVLL